MSGAEAHGRYTSGVITAQNAIGLRMIWSGAIEVQIVGSSDSQAGCARRRAAARQDAPPGREVANHGCRAPDRANVSRAR